MPDNDNNLQTEEYVLPELRVSFGSDAFRGAVDSAAQVYGLSDGDKAKLVGILRDVYIGRTEEDEIGERVMNELGRSVGDALDIYADLYADLLADLEEKLEDQRTLYINAHPEEFLPPKPESRDPHEMLADEVVAKSDIDLDDERMRKRLFDIILAFIKDVRDESETKTMLTKPTKTGGMALDENKTASIMLFANEAKGQVEQKKEEMQREMEEYEKLARAAQERQRDQKADEVQPSVSSGFTKDDARRLFAGSDEERENLKEHVTRLAAIDDEDELKKFVLGLVGEAVGDASADPLAVTAGLSMMASNGSLVTALEDKDFREPVLIKLPEDEVHAVREKIISDPKSPEAMSAFLQAFYQHVAKVNVDESARLGLRVVKALTSSGNDQYAGLVAFDMDNGVFVWTK